MTDLSHYTYGDLVAALRKDLQLDLSTDVLPNTFQRVSGLLVWITPTLINSFAPGAGSTPQYLKDPLGFVHLRGSVTTGASSANAFVLPAGFRPGVSDYYAALQSSGAAGAFIRIDTAGVVQVTYTGGIQCWFTSIHFLAEN